MKGRMALAGLAIAAICGPAAAKARVDDKGHLALEQGDVAVVHIGEGGVLVLDDARQADPNKVMDDDAPLAADHLRFAFGYVAGMGVVMKVENRYGHSLNYRALMVRGAEAKPTSVCTLAPGLRVFESWPHPLDRIVVGDLETAADGQYVCQ